MVVNERLPASVMYVRENESVAIDNDCCARTNTIVLKTGLIVNPKHPRLGCSPDGLVLSMEGIVDSFVEGKCPYKHRDSAVLVATQYK